ncbi:nitroreductase family deazaflavin-dependent oxidoreductase [Mycolicibacterium rufum]|uniref:Nitroreductase family deazaflavin-dependent oxidoreductase n=1 Tax=Mycolicibacterium rufum TaxID=318424 RepID=A0ABY3UCC8_9MYCO|nr:peptidase [Mycolicibacterium rufum]ULP35824.1 nitroreductase family deazaflavin-dependent oxidoreductase [Mycolicibacterium rufum]
MRVPRRVAESNRRVTNSVARSMTPWLPGLGTLEHVGRRSGRRYRTPLVVFETRDGFAILVGYELQTDWLKDVLAGGSTVLHKRGKAIRMSDSEGLLKVPETAPRLGMIS